MNAAGAPHIPPKTTVAGVMGQVLLALLPVIAAHVWFFGPGLLVQILLASCLALLLEALMLKLRQRPLRPFLGDGSAVVAAVLFALCIPPLAPWWVAATGMVFAIVIAKQLYGGLGDNLFNPAMTGFAAVIIAFPAELSRWPLPRGLNPALPGLQDSLQSIFFGPAASRLQIDVISGATPLDALRTARVEQIDITRISNELIFGQLGGAGWEWIALAAALGGAWLLYKGIIHWRVPAAVLGTGLIVATLMWWLQPEISPPPLQQLTTGALVLAAFFIATDPVTGCATPRGQLLFGAGVALLTLAIRRWGGYPDGVAFAILLMNMAAPLIDRLTPKRVYGH